MKTLKTLLVIGSGISGLSCAVRAAEGGTRVIIASSAPAERSQSVMAAGGINGVLLHGHKDDSIECHIEDTLRGGCYIGGRQAVTGLCKEAPNIIDYLDKIGVVFSRNEEGHIAQRSFGGQTYPRTAYAGSSTGKQIVTALVREVRKYQRRGMIEVRHGLWFYDIIESDNKCIGALFYNEYKRCIEPVFCHSLVCASGGQNKTAGMATGSALNDGYVTAKLFMRGAKLKNPEMIQYHPTTIRTAGKQMLITEAVRGEGGRLYYNDDNDERVYFMEDLYGHKGNLMPRDIVSKCIYDTGKQVMLDVSFMGENLIMARLPEVYETCMTYRGINITREPIPVEPAIHFFMGGLKVDLRHRTDIPGIYAVGECASMYHGANRLGGNSLLAAVYSGRLAATDFCDNYEQDRDLAGNVSQCESQIREAEKYIEECFKSRSQFHSVFIKNRILEAIKCDLGIVRNEKDLLKGLETIDFYGEAAKKIMYDSSISPFHSYSAVPLFALVKAVFLGALNRRESRGAHIREDYPERDGAFAAATVAEYNGGNIKISYEEEP